jgi:voltage-gated potassium channel
MDKQPLDRQQIWQKKTEWFLFGASVVFLIAYSIQVIANLDDKQAGIISVIIWVTWALFAVDYVVNLILSPQRHKWFWRNLHQLLILALPMLRPLRLLRLISLLRAMQSVALKAVQGRILLYVVSAATLLVYVGALAVLDAEQNVSGANIRNFGDAVWWAATTITTVGYGDYYPVTLIGRLVAVGLMIGGIGVLGVVTASLASWMVEQIKKPEPEKDVTDTVDAVK